jgi:hypothetical protein
MGCGACRGFSTSTGLSWPDGERRSSRRRPWIPGCNLPPAVSAAFDTRSTDGVCHQYKRRNDCNPLGGNNLGDG